MVQAILLKFLKYLVNVDAFKGKKVNGKRQQR